MEKWPDSMPGAWSIAEYLAHLRAAISRGLADDLRLVCDEWTLGPAQGNASADPIEPLRNRGRTSFTWTSPVWHSLSADLLSELRRWVETPTQAASSQLAGYIGCVHLELCAREDPPLGARAEAIVLPLVLAARQRGQATPFVRYLLGWIPRAAPYPWNQPRMVLQAALAVALDASHHTDVTAGAAICRTAVDEASRSGQGFRSHVDPGDRPLWQEIAAATTPDLKPWAGTFLR